MSRKNPADPGRTTHVAVLAHMDHDLGRRLMIGVSRYAMEQGWYVEWLNLKGAPADRLGSAEIDGIVAYVDSRSLLEYLVQASTPVVIAYCSEPNLRLPHILPDYRLAGRQVAEHFLQIGLEHFAIVVNRGRIAYSGMCRQGLRLGLPLKMRPREIHTFSTHNEGLGEWLSALPKPCGIMTVSDGIGVGLMAEAQRRGIAVGRDIAVASVGNDAVWCCARGFAALSSVEFPIEAIGYEAGSMLNMRMRGRKVTSRRVAPTELVPRASSDMLHIADHLAADVLVYVRKHFSEALALSDLATLFGVSTRSLERRFKAAVGHSLWTEIMRCRLQHAERLLLTTDCPVKVVALQSGFNAVEFFVRRFKKRTGCTPSQFRKQQSKPAS